MNVMQRPGTVELAADMPEYIIDTDSTISFEVQFSGSKILSEEYVPDAAYQVRIRKLGRFCAKALWGIWPEGNTTYQQHLSGTFSFLINGEKDADTYVLFSRFTTKKRLNLREYYLSSARRLLARACLNMPVSSSLPDKQLM